jgi:hypothetical protein
MQMLTPYLLNRLSLRREVYGPKNCWRISRAPSLLYWRTKFFLVFPLPTPRIGKLMEEFSIKISAIVLAEYGKCWTGVRFLAASLPTIAVVFAHVCGANCLTFQRLVTTTQLTIKAQCCLVQTQVSLGRTVPNLLTRPDKLLPFAWILVIQLEICLLSSMEYNAYFDITSSLLLYNILCAGNNSNLSMSTSGSRPLSWSNTSYLWTLKRRRCIYPNSLGVSTSELVPAGKDEKEKISLVFYFY